VLAGVESWGSAGGSRLVALHVGRDGTLRRVGSWEAGRWAASRLRALPLGDGRVAMVRRGDHPVRLLDLG
jgi:hypothetical protein